MDKTHDLRHWRRQQLWTNVLAAWVLLLVGAALTYGLMVLIAPDLAGLQSFLKQAVSGLKNDTNWQMALNIAWHNERAVWLVVILALIPVPLLYWVNLVGTAASIGLVLYINASHTPVGLLILAGILPHGIIEISSFAVAVGLASQLNYYVRSRTQNWRAHRYDWIGQLKWWPFIKPLLRLYLLVVVPGLLIAAAIEGFITPWLLTLVR
ncbi:stage II sporulation protein M [Loigolactobacillus jiayinensis]|uniref:Stage II sporulation protein M n=1 Tax=Loigolactobacillus jiayinensis TaxID=2486016 RepID=A0ABW1RIQ5_9LACO|nr:stage II sporulation protein M [Loigolactobacillus jiayinensis]